MWCDDACMWYDDVCVVCVWCVWDVCACCVVCVCAYIAIHTTVHGQRASESHDRTRTTCKRVTRPYTDNVQASHTTVHGQRASKSHDRTRTTCKQVTRPYTDNVQASHTTVHGQRASKSRTTGKTCSTYSSTWPTRRTLIPRSPGTTLQNNENSGVISTVHTDEIW